MPLNTLTKDASPDQVLAELQENGAVIVRDLLGTQTVDTLTAEVLPFVDRTQMGRDDFTGRTTKRTGALAARSAACRDLIVNELALTTAKQFLQPYTRKIILHLTQVIQINPGGAAQAIHRDRLAWGKYLSKDIEPQLNTIWALTDFSAENGATQCVPGSHKWSWARQPKPEEIVQAEMSKGSVFFYTGSVLHSGGANTSENMRMGINLTYCLGWLRQEENQYLSCPPSIAKDFDPVLQDLLGYTQGEYALGYYSDPFDETEGLELLPPERVLDHAAQKIKIDIN
jgi:ectoine hydroxylase-related dioxygenase (phytanoyl-CoA dioxygenase family)